MEVVRCRIMPYASGTTNVPYADSWDRQYAATGSQYSVDHANLFTWITDNLAWLYQYDTVYVFVDNRELPGNSCPEYWPYFAPWIKGRCEVVGPYQERTTAIYVPICPATGLDQVHFTWAGTFVLEALCTVYPTLNFALMDSDCVPTTLFEIAELVNLMTDQSSRAEALQRYTMASARDCPPAVLLMTESKAELNAGLVIVTGHMPTLSIRGHSAGSYAGIVWERILAEFPNIEGTTVLTAVAFPPTFFTRQTYSDKRQLHLIHHADDSLCVWTPTRNDMMLLQQHGFKITYVTGWRAYLGRAQHSYSHWTRVNLPEGRHDLTDLERMPGVLPFEVYAQAPLRLISWCSFELDYRARALLRELNTSIEKLVTTIARRQANLHTEQDFFFDRRPVPFGGSRCIETYSSTTSRSRPRTRGEPIRG